RVAERQRTERPSYLKALLVVGLRAAVAFTVVVPAVEVSVAVRETGVEARTNVRRRNAEVAFDEDGALEAVPVHGLERIDVRSLLRTHTHPALAPVARPVIQCKLREPVFQPKDVTSVVHAGRIVLAGRDVGCD